MKTYSHVRRKALDAAAAVLEPVVTDEKEVEESAEEVSPDAVTSQVTSQSADVTEETVDFPKEIGSSGWIRTSNPPVNSRMLYH